MKYEFNSINEIALFHDLNQGDETETKYMCTLYAPAINLKYNCGIDLNEDDLKKIAKVQSAAGKFSYTNGAYGSDGIDAVYKYVKDNSEERGWKVPNLVIFKREDHDDLLKWIERGYSYVLGIGVNSAFYNDIRDSIINSSNYGLFKGSIGHFTNQMKWIGRGNLSQDNGKEYFLDSYFKTGGSLYQANIKETLEDIAMNTKYIFFI